jgi:tetratricopeptide (TPR) repeat protein
MEAELLPQEKDEKSWGEFVHIKQANILKKLAKTQKEKEIQEEYYNLALLHLDFAIKVQSERDAGVKLGTRHLTPYIKKGEIFQEMKRYDEALGCYDEFIEKDPSSEALEEVEMKKVELYIEIGEPEKAREYY